jgi:hypothetical protein
LDYQSDRQNCNPVNFDRQHNHTPSLIGTHYEEPWRIISTFIPGNIVYSVETGLDQGSFGWLKAC